MQRKFNYTGRKRINRSAIRLTLLVGSYAQADAWGAGRMTERVRDFQAHLPAVIPLPHPSWRNNAWLKKNPWFEQELLPSLRERVARALSSAR